MNEHINIDLVCYNPFLFVLFYFQRTSLRLSNELVHNPLLFVLFYFQRTSLRLINESVHNPFLFVLFYFQRTNLRLSNESVHNLSYLFYSIFRGPVSVLVMSLFIILSFFCFILFSEDQSPS